MKPGQMFSAALKLAGHGHVGQFDKGGTPYIFHPLTVMKNLKTSDEELQCIALLHDYVEDVPGATLEELSSVGMSKRVIDAVDALTKRKGQSYKEYQSAILANRDAAVVKYADLQTNADLSRLAHCNITLADIVRTKKYRSFMTLIENTVYNKHMFNA